MIKRDLHCLFCALFFTTALTSYSHSIKDCLHGYVSSIYAEEEKFIAFCAASKAKYLEFTEESMEFTKESLTITNEIDSSLGIIKNTIIIGGYYFDKDFLQQALKINLPLETINSELCDAKDRWFFNSPIIPFQL